MNVIFDKLNLREKVIKATKHTIVQIFFSIVIILAFLVTPFLHNTINNTIAQIIWYSSLVYIIYISIWPKIMNKKTMCENERIDFICNWGERFLIFTLLSVFVFNYYKIDYI